MAVNRAECAGEITGLRLWDFGRALAALCCANAFRGSVIEMGAGCGVLFSGRGVWVRGCNGVCATDASSMEFLQRNVDAHRGLFVEGADVQVERLCGGRTLRRKHRRRTAPGEGRRQFVRQGARDTLMRLRLPGGRIIGTILYHLTTGALFATATR